MDLILLLFLLLAGYNPSSAMPSMVPPPGAPSIPQMNGMPRPPSFSVPPTVPGSGPTPTSSGSNPSMVPFPAYQTNPSGPNSGGFDSFNANSRAPDASH